jgi:hypothetical protein
MLLAKLLHLNKKNDEAIIKFEEIIPMVENAELKQEIDSLIIPEHSYSFLLSLSILIPGIKFTRHK